MSNANQPALGDNRGPWAQVGLKGHKFYPFSPRVEDVDIEDIAYALAGIPRFNAHTRRDNGYSYSVAQHSLHVAALCLRDGFPAVALWGLLHDAAEAFVGDMIRPLKLEMERYRRVEDQILYVIGERYGLPWPMPAVVKVADDMALATEARDLLPGGAVDRWSDGMAVDVLRDLNPEHPESVERRFLATFDALGGQR